MWTYSPYILALAKKSDSDGARAALEEMWAGGLRPNAWCYSALVQSYVQSGDLSGAEAVAQEMLTRAQLPPSPVVFNLLIQGHLRRGEMGQSRLTEILKDMTDLGMALGADTYCLLMDAAATSGEERSVERVQSLLQSMRAQGLAPDSVQLSTLSKALVRKGRGSEAVEASDELQASANASVDLIVLNQRVHLFCSEGRMEDAERATERAAAAASSSGRPPPVEAYGALIRGYYRLRDLKPLIAAFRQFLRLGGRPNRKMANAVVRLCLFNGETSTALQAIRAMKLLGVDMDVDQYKSWTLQVQRRQRSTVSGGAGSSGRGAPDGRGRGGREDGTSRDLSPAAEGLERLKWFLGLPNAYYESDWRFGGRHTEGEGDPS